MIALTPVAPHPLDDDEDARLRSIADSLSEQDDRFRRERDRYREQFPVELPPETGPTLHVDDFSVIAHVQHIPGVGFYTSRAFTRAREGDVVAGTFAPIPGYIDYVAEHLGLGKPLYCQASPAPGELDQAVFAALLADDQAQRRIAESLEGVDNEVWIHPYMGHEGAWRFAQRLTELRGKAVRVLGPLPVVTESTNNKLWFADVVRAVVGEDNALATHAGSSVDEVARLLSEVASTSPRLALKLADSASGMGTTIFDQQEIVGRISGGGVDGPGHGGGGGGRSGGGRDEGSGGGEEPGELLHELVADWMRDKEWTPERPPISIENWETEVVGSPSIQLWIPPLADGPPLMEGVFDQLFDPRQSHVFLGSVPTRTPPEVRDRIADAGVCIGRVFQYLGYTGRCSFDTILCGEEATDATIKFTECNGRWGGTSTPMSLMNRLFGDYRSQPYTCRVFRDQRLKGMGFDEFVRAFDDVLFDRGAGKGWMIVYNVGCLEPVGKLDVITLGETFEEAEERQQQFEGLVESRF